MIKEEGGKFVVYSESGRKFGTYDTKAKAKRRLAQMEMFKHMKKSAAEVVDLSVRTGPFAPIQKCKVLGAGYKCELSPLYPKPKGMQGLNKKAAVPKLKNFFANEPHCKALGSAKKCNMAFAKMGEMNKEAISPMLVRKTLSKAIGSLKTVGLEDYSRIQGKIDKMMGSTLKKSLMSGPKPNKADRVMVNVLKHESNRVGSQFQKSFLKNLQKKRNDLKIGLN